MSNTSDNRYPAYGLYYRSDNGTWYEEGIFPDGSSARDCMVEHIRMHSDLDCVVVRMSVMSEYRGFNNPVDMRSTDE